jgi:hypothetical protein
LSLVDTSTVQDGMLYSQNFFKKKHAFATLIDLQKEVQLLYLKQKKYHPYENQNKNQINTNKFIYPKSHMKLKHITKYDKYKNNNESETQ